MVGVPVWPGSRFESDAQTEPRPHLRRVAAIAALLK